MIYELLLNISIPTFNRAKRLEKTLLSVAQEIAIHNLHNLVGILVVDNASSDCTNLVIEKFNKFASANGIVVQTVRLAKNIGGGRNFIECAYQSNSDYIVFLSDDDNLFPGAIKELVDKIDKWKPALILCNFLQHPWSLENPLYIEEELNTDQNELDWLSSQVKFYKLSGITLRVRDKTEIALLREETWIRGFGHILLVIILFKAYGRGLASDLFFAYPDADLYEHIDFAPYVSEIMLYELRRLRESGFITEEEEIKLSSQIPRQSVNSRSLHRLYEYYQGDFSLTIQVKSQLWKNILDAMVFRRKNSREGLQLYVVPKDYLRLVRMALAMLKAITLERFGIEVTRTR